MAIDFKVEVTKKVKEVFDDLIESSVATPKDSKLGDFAIPCFPYAKKLGKNPAEIANDIASKINSDEVIESVSADGPFVNIKINKSMFIKEVLEEVNSKKENYGNANNEDTIVIDYGGPNVAKNMGIHNLRSTIIGQALYNVYQHLGYNVVGIDHLGDWGTQFGKLIWALEKWSNSQELEEKGIVFLNEMYVKFHDEAEKSGDKEVMEEEARAWFKKIEDGDEHAKMWWDLFVKISVEDYDKIFDRLNVKFDHTTGESFYIQFLDETIKTLEDASLTEIDDGALVVKFDEKDNMPPCLLKKRDGATLYGTRDIAAGLYRLKEYNPTKILYAVDVAQSLHFKQWFKVMEMLDKKNKDIFEHISFGRLSFPDASMSTRKGNIVPLREVLDKAKEKSLAIIGEKSPDLENKEEVAEMVGTGAIIFGDLSHDRVHNIVFEWDKVLDFQGETAPYVQYTHARIQSILRKEKSDSLDATKLAEGYDLVKKISDLNEALKQVALNNKPSVLARYVIELCQMFNNYYVHNPILKAEEETKNARLYLIEQVATVIKTSMKLLGIKVPDRM